MENSTNITSTVTHSESAMTSFVIVDCLPTYSFSSEVELPRIGAADLPLHIPSLHLLHHA